MSNYGKDDLCVGCGEHISSYHGNGCAYDPDYQNKWSACSDCGEYGDESHDCEGEGK